MASLPLGRDSVAALVNHADSPRHVLLPSKKALPRVPAPADELSAAFQEAPLSVPAPTDETASTASPVDSQPPTPVRSKVTAQLQSLSERVAQLEVDKEVVRQCGPRQTEVPAGLVVGACVALCAPGLHDHVEELAVRLGHISCCKVSDEDYDNALRLCALPARIVYVIGQPAVEKLSALHRLGIPYHPLANLSDYEAAWAQQMQPSPHADTDSSAVPGRRSRGHWVLGCLGCATVSDDQQSVQRSARGVSYGQNGLGQDGPASKRSPSSPSPGLDASNCNATEMGAMKGEHGPLSGQWDRTYTHQSLGSKNNLVTMNENSGAIMGGQGFMKYARYGSSASYCNTVFQERNTGRAPNREDVPHAPDVIQQMIERCADPAYSPEHAERGELDKALACMRRFRLVATNDPRQVDVRMGEDMELLSFGDLKEIDESLDVLILEAVGRAPGQRKPHMYLKEATLMLQTPRVAVSL